MIIGYLDLDPWGLEKIDDKGIRIPQDQSNGNVARFFNSLR